MNGVLNGVYLLQPANTPQTLNTIVSDNIQVHVLDTFANLYIANSNDIFLELADSFSFPEYFGFNLDALLDCLRELTGDHVVILGIRPDLEGQFLPVIEILEKACSWHSYQKRRFIVLVTHFPVAISRPKI